MRSYRELGRNISRAKWGIILLGIVLFSGGIAQAAPQYAVTCDFCHRMPPLDSTSGKREPATGAVKGNHQGHAGTTAASCAKCHGNAVMSYPTGHRDKLIAVQGNINNSPAAGGATYSRVFFNQTTVPPTPLGTCSNVNCHFESATYSWGSAGFASPGDCARCHGVAPATGNHPTTGSKHGRYYGTGTGSCIKCHPDHAVEGKPFAHATSAANRGIAVRFTAAPNSSGTYSGDGLNFLPSQNKTTFGTCTNLYCHSNGVAGGAPNVVPTWGASLDCKGCHNSTAASGAPMTTGKHGAHVNNAATLGTNYGCAECHARTVSNDTTIADVSRHVKGFVDFSGAKAGRSYSTGSGICSTVYCHSDGKSNYKDMTGPNWKSTGITLDCKGCHGSDVSPAFTSAAGEPNYANGGGGQRRANTHQRHAGGAADCINCHVNTVDGTGKLTGNSHANGTINVDFNPAKAGLGVGWTAGTKTCSNIQCHGTGSTAAQWGSTACLGCHTVAQNNRAAITSQFGANSHHIQGAVTDDKCYQCHWEANSDGSINSAYHHSGTPGAPVELVVYGAGARPAVYNTVNSATAVQYTANGTRPELQKINSHCLGCHSDQNNGTQPFADGKTPKQYAWDGTSVAARYTQSGTTTWGKYAGGNVSPKNIGKAFSAHGNAAANQRGWDSTNGVDGAITNTAGTVNVLCYDCHNSHGSTVVGTTTRYASATVNGGILKDTTVSRNGYAVAYKPYTGGSTANKNKRNAGASLCLDCHLNATATQTPWGYNSTFGAIQPVLGYWDSPYMGYSTCGPEQRFAYKKKNGINGGHFGASMSMTSTPSAAIGGLCTPCHDPHGVSPTLGANQQYAVPLLKGTWLTSPYKEDVAPSNNDWLTNFAGQGEGVKYHIDQNTFGSDIRGTVAGVTQSVDQSAGLCLGCHPKTGLTAAASLTSPNPWKTKNRVHESVKGWKTSDGTVEHNYTCSKCHSAHTSSVLPRLMVTNCLDSRHKGRSEYNPAPVISGSSSGDVGSGRGRIPGSYSGWGDYGQFAPPPGDVTVTCHDSAKANNNAAGGTDQGWNAVTPWIVEPPIALTAGPTSGSFTAVGTNIQATVSWSTNDYSSSYVDYGLTTGYGATAGTGGLVQGHSVLLPNLVNHSTYHYRVRSVSATGLSLISADQTFYISMPPTAPVLTTQGNVVGSPTCSVNLQFVSTDPDSGPLQYNVQVSTDSSFATGVTSSGWISASNWPVTLATNATYYWRVQTRDANHTTPQDQTSAWSATSSFGLSNGGPPPAPVLTSPASGFSDWSCDGYYYLGFAWNAAPAPAQYNIQVSTDPTFTAVSYTSGWTASTSWATGLSTTATYYWRVQARDASTLAVGPWSGSRSLTINDTGSCSGSCPMLYTWDGSKFVFEADQYPTGKLGLKTATGYAKPNPNDLYLLQTQPVPQPDGSLELRMVEERSETDYFDKAKLYSVDMPVGRDVYAEIIPFGSADISNPASALHTVDKNLKQPVSLVHVNTGNDVSAQLAASDGNYLLLNEDNNQFAWQTLEMDFGDLSQAPMLKLIIDATSVYPTTTDGFALANSLSTTPERTKLEVLDANGNWVTVPRSQVILSKPMEFRRPYVVNLSNIFLTNTYKIRLSFLFKTYVDSILFDTTADLGATINEVPLVSADLGYYGASAKTSLGGITQYMYGTPDDRNYQYMPGNLTRYGDVKPLLTDLDDKFVIFGGGDELRLKFSGTVPKGGGVTRRFLLFTHGYYKDFKQNSVIPKTVTPLPFSSMSNFPYDPTVENYPTDADHTQYQLDYNTRQY